MSFATNQSGKRVDIRANQDGRLLIENSKLDDIALNTATMSSNTRADLGSAKSTAVIGGESIPTIDPDGRNGWYFKKLANDATKINYYYYAEANTPFILGELHRLTAVISVDNYKSSLSLPFFVVYTKPTGVGDAGAWFHSAIRYNIDVGEVVNLGELVEIYTETTPTTNSLNKRKVSFNVKTIEGDGLSTEEILTISLHTATDAPIDTSVLVNYLGYEILKDGKTYAINMRLT
jgi:hypothetical protein